MRKKAMILLAVLATAVAIAVGCAKQPNNGGDDVTFSPPASPTPVVGFHWNITVNDASDNLGLPVLARFKDSSTGQTSCTGSVVPFTVQPFNMGSAGLSANTTYDTIQIVFCQNPAPAIYTTQDLIYFHSPVSIGAVESTVLQLNFNYDSILDNPPGQDPNGWTKAEAPFSADPIVYNPSFGQTGYLTTDFNWVLFEGCPGN